MADGGMTTTGLQELRALVDRFPDRLNATCARVAQQAAVAMQASARLRVWNPTPPTKGPHVHTPGESLADAIEIVEDAANHQYRVISNAPSQYPKNLVLWTEFGTRRQPARPYMRPAAEAVTKRYERDMQAAIDGLAREVFGS